MARKITFVRHGQTDKVKPDSARHLTDEGKAQAARRREALGNPRFDLGIHSPMDRAHQTLEIIAGGPIMTKVVPQLLHDSGTNDGKLLDEAAEQLGYAPMKDYFEKTSLETQEAAQAIWNICVAGHPEGGRRHQTGRQHPHRRPRRPDSSYSVHRSRRALQTGRRPNQPRGMPRHLDHRRQQRHRQ